MSYHGFVFTAQDDTRQSQLWISDGTNLGTHRLLSIPGAYSAPNGVGIEPLSFLSVANLVYFFGYDQNLNRGLWRSDGTVAGTLELTPAGASIFGQGSLGLAAFNGRAIYQAADGNLGVSSGTRETTYELSGIPNGNANGILSGQILYSASFGGRLYFDGVNSSNIAGLWSTDGTAAGTHELSGIAGTGSGGLFADYVRPHFTPVGNQMFFIGQNASQLETLWVTDGTSAGTHEVSGVVGGNGEPVHAYDVASLNGKLIYVGDSEFPPLFDIIFNGVWISDGTSSGAHELFANGMSSNGRNIFIEGTFNGHVLFSSYSIGSSRLYTTDGTDAGTQVLLNSGFRGMAVSDGHLVIFADGANGAETLVSDGTVQGTHILSELTSIHGAPLGGLAPGDVIAVDLQLRTENDLFADGNSDLILQSDGAGGVVSVWHMSGAQIGTGVGGYLTLNGATHPSTPDWKFLHSGDFFNDGSAALAWQNPYAGGVVSIWHMHGTAIDPGTSGYVNLNGLLHPQTPDWTFLATGDVNADGYSDFVWQNSYARGVVLVWQMNGTQINPSTSGYATVNGQVHPSTPDWKFLGAGDIFGDGRSDLIWKNDYANGVISVWHMNGTAIDGNSSGYVIQNGQTAHVDPAWNYLGSGHMFGPGSSDLIWQDSQSHSIFVWDMNGAQIDSNHSGWLAINGSNAQPSADWHFLRTGDFNGDGFTDLAWQNSSGNVSIWMMHGLQIDSSVSGYVNQNGSILPTTDAGWHIL